MLTLFFLVAAAVAAECFHLKVVECLEAITRGSNAQMGLALRTIKAHVKATTRHHAQRAAFLFIG